MSLGTAIGNCGGREDLERLYKGGRLTVFAVAVRLQVVLLPEIRSYICQSSNYTMHI